MLYGPNGQSARQYLASYDFYTGASRTRRSMRGWTPVESDANSSIIYDLPTLRARSYDLYRNNPLGASAIKTLVTSVIGHGLKYHPRIDRDFLGMSDDEADRWEDHAQREWEVFANSKELDIAEELNFAEMTDLFLRERCLGGDVFAILPRETRRTSSYKSRVQLIEAARVTNRNNAPDSESLIAGIQRDRHGRMTHIHVQHSNPFSRIPVKNDGWSVVPVFGATTGRRNVIHGKKPDRINQARGVPFLAVVIEELRQTQRYRDNEVMAAVVSAMLTVFIEQTQGDRPMGATEEQDNGTVDMQLASGAIIGLAPGEKANGFNPARPNSQFEPFMQSMAQWIGAALEIPYELLLKRFTASYSASRAAFMMAWKFFLSERAWCVNNFCKPIQEMFLVEAITTGRLSAPGFLTDPLIRAAYCGAEWIGPPKGQIDELKEGQAAKLYNEMTVKTLSEITAEVNGGDWDRKIRRIKKERERMKEAGVTGETSEIPKPDPLEEMEFEN